MLKLNLYTHSPQPPKPYGAWLFSGFLMILSSVVISTILLVAAYRWINPPLTWLMVDRYVKGETTKFKPKQQVWVTIDCIAPQMIQAVVAAEDNLFLTHNGFDFKSLKDARKEMQRGRRVRGASTISMQVSKNVFLWHGKTMFRKTLEAGVTMLVETLWSKKRIMEVYLNIAEFGPAIYGVEAASNIFFKCEAKSLNRYQAALLTSVLPNPLRRNPNSPSQYMRSYQQRVLRNMYNIGEVNLTNHSKK